MASVKDGLYWEFHVPLELHDLVQNINGRQVSDPNLANVVVPPSQREWLSQARPATDTTTEVIQMTFKSPMPVSELSFEALRVTCLIELWYQDRQNNWRAIMDRELVPLTVNLSSPDSTWYKFHSLIYPVVARGLQIRLTRGLDDRTPRNQPYRVGLRDVLIRRNIYERTEGMRALEDEQDALGNIISKYIRDWDATKAIDNDPYTYWKSEPMPDPNAVASLYLNVQAPDGTPQLVDGIYLDPLYINQDLNIYYSIDDTVGTRKISPVSLVPHTNDHTNWKPGKGRWDTSSELGTSDYKFPLTIGPLIYQNAWIGIEWAPDFDQDVGPPHDPTLFEVVPTNDSGSQYWPVISYDVGAEQIKLTLTNGSDVRNYVVDVGSAFITNRTMRIVAGWDHVTKDVLVSVATDSGVEVGQVIITDSGLPPHMTLDGDVGFTNFRGLFTNHIVKLDDFTGYRAFQANPTVYVSPDPVIPNSQGTIPSTTLDNAIIAVDWRYQERCCGGSHRSHFHDKEWTPIWKKYTSQKGKLFFPQQFLVKYLKLEFTRLTEEPYPIYDVGVPVTYDTYPLHEVTIQPAPSFDPGMLGFGGDVVLGGIQSVNWLNPSSISSAVNAVTGLTTPPVVVNSSLGALGTSAAVGVGGSTVLSTGVSSNASPGSTVDGTIRTEASNPYVYRRQVPSTAAILNSTLNTVLKEEPLQGSVSPLETLVPQLTSMLLSTSTAGSASPLALPVQGTDWWVFPGQTLRMPASVLTGLTTQDTTTTKTDSSERESFLTTQVHRYDQHTVIRDVALAYFAGVREAQPLVTSFIANEDPVSFNFTTYDSSQWVLTNIKKYDTGPISSARPTYFIDNPGFDRPDPLGALYLWRTKEGTWTWDPNPVLGHWYPGTARVDCDGTDHEMESTEFDVAEGWDLSASVWLRWSDVVATGAVFQLNATTFLNEVEVGTLSLAEMDHGDWLAYASSEWDDGGTAEFWVEITGGVTIPAGVDRVRLRLTVTSAATAGTVHFDTVTVWSEDDTEGTIYKDFTTTSNFARVQCQFQDSGVRKSDGMWARMDPLDTNISNVALAYYTTTIPDIIPSGTWADTFHDWGDANTAWGTPRAVVAIDVDPDRIFDNKRVLHFFRAGGAEEAGIKVRQETNFVANGLFRICAVWYKPFASDNEVTVRLRRVSDGVYIHEEVITHPTVGTWHTFQSHFIEIPDSHDQVYTVELVLTGDDEDEFYLSDLWCDVAQIRYFVRLGDSGEYVHDVTELRYADSAYVSCTTPVNEVLVQATILTDRSFAYGAVITPDYLQ